MLNWDFPYYLKSPCDPAPGSANVTVTPKPRDIVVTQIICDTRDNPLLWNLTLPPHPEHLAQSAKVLLVYQLDIPLLRFPEYQPTVLHKDPWLVQSRDSRNSHGLRTLT